MHFLFFICSIETASTLIKIFLQCNSIWLSCWGFSFNMNFSKLMLILTNCIWFVPIWTPNNKTYCGATKLRAHFRHTQIQIQCFYAGSATPSNNQFCLCTNGARILTKDEHYLTHNRWALVINIYFTCRLKYHLYGGRAIKFSTYVYS